MYPTPLTYGLARSHLDRLRDAAARFSDAHEPLARWGSGLARVLADGGRLLLAGNGGSAAQAQHLAAELVGKLHDDRAPLSAIALTADTCAVTAIGNDYGFRQVFARQVRAHGRPGDIVLLMSTSGRSENLLAAADAANAMGMRCWGLTGARPNPLASRCDEVISVPSTDTQVIQELHLVTAHLLCAYVDTALSVFHEVAPARMMPAVQEAFTATAALP